MKNTEGVLTEKKISVERGKRGILKVLFGRTAIVVILVIIQALALLAAFSFLEKYILYAYGVYQVFMGGVVIYIINRPVNPDFKIAWIIPILTLPIFGGLLYIFVNMQIGGRLMNMRINSIGEATKKYAKADPVIMEELRENNVATANLATYLSDFGGGPAYRNTTVKYFPSGEEKFEELQQQLKEAKQFIFLEYFIIQEGVMWDTILEILIAKAKEGVEVRLMYDGTCTLALLPHSYPKTMKSLGIKCKVFAPIRPALSTYQNNRDHRKIVVIDGKVAFTGGVNLADEYINQKVRFGHWKDTAIMLRGEAVHSFTLMFLQLWNMDTKMEDYAHYLNADAHLSAPGATGYVIPYADSPLDDENVGEMVYLDIINTARHYVHIMTPYLILDNEMMIALKYAAKRGVDVCIIMPHIPDKIYALLLAKTYYPELIKAGVKIYAYTPGFIHAKSFVSDNKKAVVGTINLDFRSLYLHFECAAYMYEIPAIKDIEDDFQDTMAKSRLITLLECQQEKLIVKILGKVLRLIAPLM